MASQSDEKYQLTEAHSRVAVFVLPWNNYTRGEFISLTVSLFKYLTGNRIISEDNQVTQANRGKFVPARRQGELQDIALFGVFTDDTSLRMRFHDVEMLVMELHVGETLDTGIGFVNVKNIYKQMAQNYEFFINKEHGLRKKNEPLMKRREWVQRPPAGWKDSLKGSCNLNDPTFGESEDDMRRICGICDSFQFELSTNEFFFLICVLGETGPYRSTLITVGRTELFGIAGMNDLLSDAIMNHEKRMFWGRHFSGTGKKAAIFAVFDSNTSYGDAQYVSDKMNEVFDEEVKSATNFEEAKLAYETIIQLYDLWIYADLHLKECGIPWHLRELGLP